MATTHVTLPAINNAIRDVCCALNESDYQNSLWSNLNENDLWRELVACILGSRVRFELAHSAVLRLEKMQLLSQKMQSICFIKYEQDVKSVLSGKTLEQEYSEPHSRYPFFRIRANQIRLAAERLYGEYGSIRSFLSNARDFREARRYLVSEVAGLGPKQASLFLRNIGYAEYVAVLDVHVLTYMSWIGLTDTLVKSISTVRKYELLENTFIEHSLSFGFTPGRFDLAVWVVVKVAKEEYKTWG